MAGKLRQDDDLIEQLARGETIRRAARLAGFSERSAHRRLADPAFRLRIQEIRAAAIENTSARLSHASNEAALTLRYLLTSESDAVRLGAARAILDTSMRYREAIDFETRLSALETAAKKDAADAKSTTTPHIA